MASEKEIQEMVYRFEEGVWKRWILLGAIVMTVMAMYALFIFDPMFWGLFKGLSHPKAMEQAVVSREIARGNGFSTKVFRPAAMTQIQRNLGVLPMNRMPDTYTAPLWPVATAPFLKMEQSKWAMGTRDYVYVCDRTIASVAAFFFFFAVAVNYFTIRRLFDNQLAVMGSGIVLLGDLFWKYSLSGLPQMLMLFLFSCAFYLLVRAVETRQEEVDEEDMEDEKPHKSPLPWLCGASVVFGLLALTHAITLWIFAGILFFCAIYFKPRIATVLAMLGIVVLVYSPWIYRNYRASGSLFGVAPYSVLHQIRGSESTIMRDTDLRIGDVSPTFFRAKIQNQLSGHLDKLCGSLGQSIVAPVFFVALLYLFKRRATSHIRWLLLVMWLFALFGMAVAGSDDPPGELRANDLHVLFAPLFTAYGLAFLLVLWTHLEIHVSLLRNAFLVVLFGVSALPLFNTFTAKGKGVFQWPPYVPPYIAILGNWVNEKELIVSDMPWGVAWYADRGSIWLPLTVQDFVQYYIQFNDYKQFDRAIAGLYLTPYSGNASFISDIVKGEYKDWSPFILRSATVKDFPLKAVTGLPIDGQCIFYSDRDRWTERAD